MVTKLNDIALELQQIRQFGIFDDFIHRDTDDFLWKDVTSGTGASVAIDADGVGGIVTLTAGTGDNDQAYLRTTNEVFKFDLNKPLIAVARIKVTEGAANKAAFAFGVIDNPTNDTIQDNEGGPPSTYHGALFFKNSASGDLQVESSAASSAAQTTTTTEVDPVSGNWESYKLEVEVVSDAEKRVTFWHDADGGMNWKQLKDTNGNLIKHTISFATPAAATGEMALFVGIKNSSAAGSQTMDVDYLGCWQLRID